MAKKRLISMANLTNEQYTNLWAELMRGLSRDGESIGIDKHALKDAVIALDSYIDATAAEINQAIPQPARNALTIQQKARMLMLIMKYRYTENA